MKAMRTRITSAHAIAMVALFFALTGGAFAAVKLAKNSVKSATIKNGQVKAADLGNNAVLSKHIKNGQVSSADIKDGTVGGVDLADGGVGSADLADGSVLTGKIGDGQVTAPKLADGSVGTAKIGDGQVTSPKIADGTVGAADLAPDEPFHLVGTAGQPAFSTGGEGDCLWSNLTAAGIQLNPTGFYKGKDGIVHFTGAAQSVNGSGGDGACGGSEPGIDDITPFVLPAGYRPPHLVLESIVGGSGLIVLINGDQPVVLGTQVIPPGVVAISGSSGPTTVAFDGVDFRAAGAETGITRAAKGPVHIDPSVLRALGVKF
jgi:hypothetical protein